MTQALLIPGVFEPPRIQRRPIGYNDLANYRSHFLSEKITTYFQQNKNLRNHHGGRFFLSSTNDIYLP